MQKRYGVIEFADLTGISRTTLHRMRVKGELPGNEGGKNGGTYYLYSDFSNEFVKQRMESAGHELPQSLKDEIVKDIMQGAPYEQKSPPPTVKLVIVDKPSVPTDLLPTTTYYDLEKMQEGLLKKVIHPIEGLNYIGRSSWNIAIKTLVAQSSFKVADVQTLIQYCQTIDQIEAYRAVIYDFIDETGRVNPLLKEIASCKGTVRALAKDLHLNPDSRKGIAVLDVEPDNNTKGWIEAVK